MCEIRKHSVAHVLRGEPARPSDLLGAAAVVRADDLSYVLGIQSCRKRCRPHEVDEHYRELPTLGPYFPHVESAI